MNRLALLFAAALALIAAPLVAPVGARAQGAEDPGAAPSRVAGGDGAFLVADDVRLMPDDVLVATGNVEVIHEGRRLQANSITYDGKTEHLSIEGPITLREGETTLILADDAELDRDMRNGLLTGARVVLASQLQLAANAMTRVEGRYSQLYKTAVSSCRICETGRPPLWQIRSRRLIHDEEERQLYFHDAQLRVLDVPVFYLPRLRLPDPTLERATGFLFPTIYNSSLLGFGVKVPYFIRMGDHRDLTLTPFLTTNTRTLEFRYRQAFVNGGISILGAVSNDELTNDEIRGYMFAEGSFNLRNDFKLTFDLEVASDDSYLYDYNYTFKDRLDSEIALERVRRDEFIRGSATYFHALRARDPNPTLASLVGRADYERRIYPGFGGELRFSAQAHSHRRSSDLNIDGPDADPWADGRDVTRFSLSADWLRNWTFGSGLLAEFRAGLAADSFHIAQSGALSSSSAAQITPSTSMRLRWPLLKRTQTGVTHLIEPVAQLSWVGGSNLDIPNDENTRVEFDEGNLFAVSRFSGPDRRERGLNAAYGIQWTRLAPKGWETALAVGQVVRDEQELEPTGIPSLSRSSGLRDEFSDVLLAGQLRTPGGFILTGRGLFDENFEANKAEARASWRNYRTSLSATYIWLRNDPFEERSGDLSEWSIDGSYRFARHWTADANWRYDVARDLQVNSGIGLTYTNECVEVALSASRRFTNSSNVEPTTDISLTVALRGFSTTTSESSFTRACRN